MKNFPFKILFLCIFFPPVLYIFTLNGLEIYLHNKTEERISAIVIKNEKELYAGRHSVRDEINRNISGYLIENAFHYRLGINTDVIIKTNSNNVLYPSQLNGDRNEYQHHAANEVVNYMDVAAENYSILNDGLIILPEVRIRQNSWLSNSILVFYIFLALLILRSFILRSLRYNEEREKEQANTIAKLSERLFSYENEISNIKEKEKGYSDSIGELNREKANLSSDIDGLLEEMERLESGLKTQKELRETREREIDGLKKEIEEIKLKSEKSKKKGRRQEIIDKRFRVLYKNLTFTEKAIDGFVDLSDELQLKAEEVIHRINEDDSAINIRRKVFSKGGKINVLEVDFAYSGRIYYQKETKAKSNIIAIGTKATQTQDLGYLEREYN
ncbi:MAG: hypothetical protein GX654_11125 [Desulfatiglans sp.]|jgi:hypothetical protein|nr:hypothetical protein [Desulfatiglans sp.]